MIELSDPYGWREGEEREGGREGEREGGREGGGEEGRRGGLEVKLLHVVP